MRKAGEDVWKKWRNLCICKYFWILIPLAALAAIVIAIVAAYCFSSWHMREAMADKTASTMAAAAARVAADMEPLLQANRSAAAVADSLRLTVNRSAFSFSKVGPKLYLAFAMHPRLAEMSYDAVGGGSFSFYRADDGQPRAMFTSSRGGCGGWYTQAVDPATGRLVGSASPTLAAERLPNTTQLLADVKNGSRASLGAGRARPGVRMLLFSAAAGGGDDAGVVSAAVAVDDVFLGGGAGLDGMDIYYAVGGGGDQQGGEPATAYRSLHGENPSSGGGGAAAQMEKKMAPFANVKCTASAIGEPPKLELHHGARSDKYSVACTNFDASGVKLGFRVVLRNHHEESMLQKAGVAVVAAVVALAAAAAALAACLAMARALRRATAREAVLNADLVRQKEALRQAERKSMNKSNAFASASHDIRSALAAIAGLVEVSRSEASPGVMDNLNQMDVCTKKLFGILNTILDTSKVESGKMQLEEVEFSMADVLEESVDMANVTGVTKGIEVVWDPCDLSVLRCGRVVGDGKRLRQVLDNLLGNALKFTDDGHVVLRAWANRPIATGHAGAPSRFACRRRRRRPRGSDGGFLGCLFGAAEDCAEQQKGSNPLQNDPNSVEFYFKVVDTGVGIAREKREAVFENYVQVKEGHGGTGLGLGIVQSFVRLMGGEISIKDKDPGEAGTCFRFNLFLKMSDRQEAEDIEEGNVIASESDARASMFRKFVCFRGVHCILFVHGEETRRILQTWMESIGVKVWLIPRVELIASTVEKVQSSSVSPSRASPPSVDRDDADRCFSSKEMVNQVLPMALRNSNSLRGNFGWHHPFGLLVIIDVSNERLDDICREVTHFVKMKHHGPCRVVCLTDLKTSSEDIRRLREMGCDLVLRKPIHGSRLYTLLKMLRDLHVSPAQQSSHVGPENAGSSQQDLPKKDLASTSASSEISSLAQEAKVEDDKPLAGMRVLLVEDTLVLQTIQKRMLNQLGATVELAADGSKAVEMFRDALEQFSVLEENAVVPLPFDAIFMDCQMPLMDGYEATKRIREEESRYGIHTPIIALTAHAMEDYQQEAIKAGMDLHLTKPIERKRIIEAVHHVCKAKN